MSAALTDELDHQSEVLAWFIADHSIKLTNEPHPFSAVYQADTGYSPTVQSVKSNCFTAFGSCNTNKIQIAL
jgi:hypothetical protein